MTVTFATHNGNAHPVLPPLAIHPAIKEKEPEQKRGLFRKAVGLAGKKALHTGKLAKAKHDRHVAETNQHRDNIRVQINSILNQDDLTSNQKYRMVQEIMIRNKKYLQKDDYKIYNQRLRELYGEMTTPPHIGHGNVGVVTSSTPSIKFKEPTRIGNPSDPKDFNEKIIGRDNQTNESITSFGNRIKDYDKIPPAKSNESFSDYKARMREYHNENKSLDESDDDKISVESRVSAERAN